MRKTLSVLSFAAMTAVASPSFAGGLLGDVFVRPFSPDTANRLDAAHAKMGNPLDHVANGAAGAAVTAVTGNPALGAGTTTVLEANTAHQHAN